jgi:predicted amidophosphoribosyltransferase
VVLDILFPGRCLICGEWLHLWRGGNVPVCGACQAELRPLEGPRCRTCSIPLVSETGLCTRCRVTQYAFSAHLSLFAYTGPARQLISRYKFSGRRSLAALFAGMLAREIHGGFGGMPVVPVPPRPGRPRPDPVGRIAGILERAHGVEVLRVLARAGGPAQKSLDFAGRRSNLEGRIRVRGGHGVDLPVLLLDDVFTTGATADACARVLTAAGCPEVRVLTICMEP